MRFLRYSAPLFILCAVLAACGGGGGGGGVTPPGGGGGGGGGGGSTPSPSPTHSTSPTPTSSPTVQPSPSPSGGVPVDKNYALNAGVGPQENPPGTVFYNAGTTAQWTQQNGEPLLSAFGDTSASIGSGNNFGTIDGMNCTNQNDNNPGTYAVHSFVAIYYNGSEIQVPSAVGMQNPAEPTGPPKFHPNDYYEVEAWNCEYNVHTHDFSGLVHIVDNGQPQNLSPNSPLPYKPTLKSLFDVWGITYSPNGITIPGQTPNATLSGPVTIYAGTQGTDKDKNGNYLTDAYSQVSDPSQVSLAFHDTIVIVIGNLPQLPDGFVGIPSVSWGVEN